VEIIPVRVVEIVPVLLVPVAVVEIVPVLVVEMMPLFVVEIVPPFAKLVAERVITSTAAHAMGLMFFIVLLLVVETSGVFGRLGGFAYQAFPLGRPLTNN
jgi:hypothetical protein